MAVSIIILVGVIVFESYCKGKLFETFYPDKTSSSLWIRVLSIQERVVILGPNGAGKTTLFLIFLVC